MKRFIVENALFLVILVVTLVGYDCYYYYSGKYIDKINGQEVYNSIRQSKKKQHKKKIMIGDSVGHQLFPSWQENDSVAFMACNQAATMAGMYFLVANYIETNKEDLPQEVILLCTPDLLSNYLDRFSYQYFLKPFKQSEYKKWSTSLLQDRIREVRFWWTTELPFIRTNNYTTTYTLSAKDFICISPLSSEYIMKIDSICQEHSLSFRIQSVPLDSSARVGLDTRLRESCEAGELPRRLFQPYIESVFYMPAEAYVDGCHFNHSTLDTLNRQQFVGRDNLIHQKY